MTAASFLPRYALENIPRYTSYPPANRFHDGIGNSDWSAWMAALKPNARLSLYLHIPFCKSMCWYCGCNTTIPNKDDRVARYLTALHTEIAQRAQGLPVGARVHHIHFGGGSPDMLSPDRFRHLMRDLRAQFDIAPDAQIAVELDPRGITAELAKALADSGVNRASLGVQDLSEEVQTLIHRVQPRQQVEAAIDTLRQAGIKAINLDVMYGLPAQTVERVETTTRAAVEMSADRVAVFGYAHVPWFKKHQKAIPEDRLPGAQARFDQMRAAACILAEAGYDTIGFDHFAKPGDALAKANARGELARNFQGYTDDAYDALIGLGASAISDTAAGFAQNHPDPVGYAKAVQDNQGAIMRGVARSQDDQIVSAQIERLMCDFKIALPARLEPAKFADLAADGLVHLEGRFLSVLPAGRPYIRNIAARLDPEFRVAGQQHSQAV